VLTELCPQESDPLTLTRCSLTSR